jgi:hypothetical protein
VTLETKTTYVATSIVGASLGGCATAIEGTSQEIVVNANPAGASVPQSTNLAHERFGIAADAGTVRDFVWRAG